jgi:hypothetical protein
MYFFSIRRLFILIIFFTFFSNRVEASDLDKFKKEVLFYSEKLENTEEEIFLLKDKVLLIYQDFTLEADYLLVDLKNGRLKAKGNIRLINGDVKILADEFEADIRDEYLKITKANINLGNMINFTAKEIFAIKKFFTIDGIKYENKDSKLPIPYSVLTEKLNIFPFNDVYSFTQIKDSNFGLFNVEKLLPIDVPFYQTFIRNPLVPLNYEYQRRIRGFYNSGAFFLRSGLDGWRGPWASATMAYLSNANSNGFLTLQYGLYTNLEADLYHDLTDNNGNLLQVRASYNQFDRILNKSNFSSTIDLTHDWDRESLSLRAGFNETYNDIIYHRVPEVALYSVHRRGKNTGLLYRYDFQATRFIINQGIKTSDIGRVKSNIFMNTPEYNIYPNLNLSILGETNFLYYFGSGTHYAGAYQINLTHTALKNLNYILKYRQKAVFGKTPVVFETITPYQLAGIQVNWIPYDFIEIVANSEFNLNTMKFSNIDIITNYKTDLYTFSFYTTLNLYNPVQSNALFNVGFNYF